LQRVWQVMPPPFSVIACIRSTVRARLGLARRGPFAAPPLSAGGLQRGGQRFESPPLHQAVATRRAGAMASAVLMALSHCEIKIVMRCPPEDFEPLRTSWTRALLRPLRRRSAPHRCQSRLKSYRPQLSAFLHPGQSPGCSFLNGSSLGSRQDGPPKPLVRCLISLLARNGRSRRASMSLSDRPSRGRLTLVPPVILVMSVEARCARCGCRPTRVRAGPSSRRGLARPSDYAPAARKHGRNG
jgi:hypothetical protein